MPLTESEIRALLNLLAEPEAERAQSIISHVATLTSGDLAHLEVRARGASAHVLNNLESALARARYRALDRRWRQLASRRVVDLEQALVLVASAELGDDGQHAFVKRKLDELAERTGARLAGDRAFDNGLSAITEVLGAEAGLRGNRDNYYEAANSYLPVVLERGLGIPISLCSVAILVAQRLELPVCGIGAPGHFLGFYGDPALQQGSYFDPFDGFVRLSRAAAEKIVREAAGQFDGRSLAPVNEREIVARTMRNLIAIHRRRADMEAADRLLGWLDVLINH